MATKTYSPFQKALYELTSDKPAGSLLYIIEFCAKLAAQKISLTEQDERELIEEIFDKNHELRDIRKIKWERRQTSGPEEITLPNESTSADAGYVS